MIQLLNDDWQFRQKGKSQWYPAKIPGYVHLDLLDSKLIDDPFYRTNEKDLQWIEKEDWEYKCNFDINPDILKKTHIQMVFEGLDTYANVKLNDQPILSTDNMFRAWQVEAGSILRTKQNELFVHFKSPILEKLPEVQKLSYKLPSCQDQEFGGTSVFTRKAPYHYGWDWGPRLVSCGIWQSVKIEAWDNIRISDLTVITKDLDKTRAKLEVRLEMLSDKAENANCKIFDDRDTVNQTYDLTINKGLNTIIQEIEILAPELWWPAGYGEQPLYTIHAEVITKNESTVASRRIGLRKLELARENDNWGQSFAFKVNDVPIFIKGANWIPADSFPPRITVEKYRYLLESAVKANMNMLRVWGGGIYESDTFYNLCDELGLLVWQDFMFACSLYPGDENFLESVRLESRYQVRRLRNHPSIALWCGNNEMAEGWNEWKWRENLPLSVRKDYERLFHGVLADVCQAEDPTRSYWASSPGSDITSLENPQDQSRGDIHYWGVWHGKEPFESFKQQSPRFVSEFGFQSFPEPKTVDQFTIKEDQNIFSPVMLSHQRSLKGNSLIKTYMKKYYNVPADFNNFLLLSQVLQAEGIKMAVEHFRRIRPRCMGSLYWQLNDCWPVASWSSIDYYGRWKALQYYARRFYAPILISSNYEDETYKFYVVSDKISSIEAKLRVVLSDFSGELLLHKDKQIQVYPLESAIYFSLNKNEIPADNDPATTFLYCYLEAGYEIISENAFYFLPPRDLKLYQPEISIDIQKDNSEFLLKLSSKNLVRNVILYVENVEGHFEDNYFDLFPGQVHKIRFLTDLEIDEIEFKNSLSILTLFELMER